ncbi:rho guanine nucleotide exchange factor 11 isoform X3 [Ischnura elegans]|uniref:rho guanine nucleotide exchange factor 11 isoform X3 n=1 Tax=Ischnura elegans TaxID=197161 RepID=UPI001ED870FF|nr:rho guanine nucleotide exchange factor 11 isoform X3 [Ischnura elegans]
MDNTTSGSAERPLSGESFGPLPPPGGGGGAAADPPPPLTPSSLHSSSSFRRPASLDSPNLTVTVVVHKDDTGYGMKVSGDNPVYVQAVKEGGAAERAGLHSGDKIIKVNGIVVTQSTHTEVVELIKSAPQVVLTVQQRVGGVSSGASFRSVTMPGAAAAASSSLWGPTSPGSQCGSPSSSSPISPPTTPGPGGRGGHHHHFPTHHHKNSSERITGPQPVDTEKLRQLEHQRVRTFQLMLEKEQCYVDRLRSELVRSNDPKKAQELTNAERRVRTLQQQLLMALSPSPATSSSSSTSAHEYSHVLHGHSLSLRSPPSSHNAPPSGSPPERHLSRALSSSEPPPLPSRNRPLSTSSHSPPPGAAFLGSASLHHHHGLSVFQSAAAAPPSSTADVVNSPTPPPPPCHAPPPLPPRTNSPHIYSQLQFTDGVDSGLTQGNTENLHKLHTSSTNRCQGTAPHGGGHTHQRAKSSPDPLSMSLADGSKNVSSSGSVCDLSLSTRKGKGGSGVWESDSPRVTPPGTPPPPYGGAARGAGGTEHASAETEDVDSGGGAHRTDTDLGFGTGRHEAFPHRPNGGAGQAAHTSIGGLPIQQPIIAMEDDEMSDQEVVEDCGPFKSLSKLWEHTAHLAVFMNYVASNSDPSSLLFYLLTDLYKEGNAKEMRKWAYEVHSTFLVPGAPLRLNNVDENVAREVDEVLLNEADKEEILRRVFWKARLKAKEELNEQLADFQQRRTAGLGTLFGPSDAQLDESIHDKNKEARIVDGIFTKLLEPCMDDIESEADIRRVMLSLALITVAGKTFGLRSSQYSNVIDRCPTFVSKEKSLKSKFIGKSRKSTIKGHNFVLHQYYTVTHCNHCGLIIWGLSPQGYQCTNCQMNIHRQCTRTLEENCAGPLLKKERANDRISKLMEKIRPEREARRKPSSLNASAQNGTFYIDLPPLPKIPPLLVERARRHGEDHEDGGHLTDGEPCLHGSGERPSPGGGSGGRGDRRPDPVKEQSEEHHPHHHGPRRSPLHGGGADGAGRNHEDDADHHHHHHHRHDSSHQMGKKATGTSINRSESYKERVQKRQLRERRKTSDPNLSKTNDVDLENQGLSYHTNSGSSSNSSSLSLDSPSNSLEMVTGATGRGAAGSATVVAADPNCTATGAWSTCGVFGNSASWNDSDTEAEPDPPDWTKNVPDDVLRQLTAREKKRQDVINELFHTERSHVRNLKVLDRVFYRPMVEQGILSSEQIQLLFANLEEMLDIHSQFNSAMKAKRREAPVVERVGEILLSMLDGGCGENFENAAARFCARQQIALESLKEWRRKDTRLNLFLTDAEAKPVCRRLQLKDIIPTGMLRLTKYPLLFESLAKYTDDDTKTEGSNVGGERSQILRALERSKRILDSVNQAVREAEDQHRLHVIQQRLEKSAFEKADHPMSTEFKNLDLTKYRLIYEGSLSWRAGSRSKTIDLHVVLLEEVVILLQKQDDKFVLRFHSVSSGTVGGAGGGGITSGGRDDSKLTHSPIIKLATVLVRPVATDKRAFFLVNTSGPQIYELLAVSSSERKTWFRHISEAAEAYKARDAKNRRPDLPSVSPAASAPSVGPTSETPSPSVPPPANAYYDASSAAGKAKDLEENGEVAVGSGDGGAGEELAEVDGALASGEPSATAIAPPDAEAMTQKAESLNNGFLMLVDPANDKPQSSSSEGPGTQQQLSPGAPLVASGPGSSPAPSPGTQRRAMAGGETLRLLTEESPLIQPSEVVVSQRAVLTAQPVLTPLEKLRRKDEVVIDALVEKHLLVADLLHVPHEEFDSIADMASEPAPDKDINELLLAAIHHADQLMVTINETLRVTEEEAVSARSEVVQPSCGANPATGAATAGCSPRIGGRRTLAHRMPGVPVPPLLNISSALNSTLSLLMKHVKEREEERERLRRELQRSRELIHARNQNDQRMQWHDPLVTPATGEDDTKAIEHCESGVRDLDLGQGGGIEVSGGEGAIADCAPAPQDLPPPSSIPPPPNKASDEGESTGGDQRKGKSSEETAEDPSGDVYVDALSSYSESEVTEPKEEKSSNLLDEMEPDSLECEDPEVTDEALPDDG